jgi:hypothetical protein
VGQLMVVFSSLLDLDLVELMILAQLLVLIILTNLNLALQLEQVI